jgi:hypothetical protein
MPKQIGRFSFRDESRIRELIADLSDDQKLEERWELSRVVGGKGWLRREDPGGICVDELSADECDAYIRSRSEGDAKYAERSRQEEEQRREYSRQSREIAESSAEAGQ